VYLYIYIYISVHALCYLDEKKKRVCGQVAYPYTTIRSDSTSCVIHNIHTLCSRAFSSLIRGSAGPLCVEDDTNNMHYTNPSDDTFGSDIHYRTKCPVSRCSTPNSFKLRLFQSKTSHMVIMMYVSECENTFTA